ncbi:hypothetical protein [Olivibacter sitiensis]|uniref:hypothetical protein n=1 Tax=Olivibacter sitiensis TaxID=376470 RepID=UPI001B7F9775|nr:hypothetical protein [Olivibacter sitiensis]
METAVKPKSTIFHALYLISDILFHLLAPQTAIQFVMRSAFPSIARHHPAPYYDSFFSLGKILKHRTCQYYTKH